MPTFGSTFSGIDGLGLGLERAGWECKWQIEVDEYCRRVLERHWPNVPRFGDIRGVGAETLVSVDLIVGGFPCQDISFAGKGVGIAGERSGLWVEFYRLIRELRPQYTLVENVGAITGRGLGQVLGDLAEIGYDAEWDCIPAAAVGAPHLRERVFIVAYPGGNGLEGRHCLPRSQKDLQAYRCEAKRKYWDGIPEPRPFGVDHGTPYRVQRTRATGNAVVPAVAEFIGRGIMTDYARRASQ